MFPVMTNKKLAEVFTVSKLALSLFQTRFLTDKLVASPSSEIIMIEKQSYFGGVTQVIRRDIVDGYYYDINSHYPNSMIGEMPQYYWKIEGNIDDGSVFKQDERSWEGFYEYAKEPLILT